MATLLKVLVCVLLATVAFAEEEDDGQYDPAKFEAPFMTLETDGDLGEYRESAEPVNLESLIQPTDSPVQPEESLVQPAETPVPPAESLVQPPEPPMQSAESPMPSTEPQVQPAVSPVQPAESPVQPAVGGLTEKPVFQPDLRLFQPGSSIPGLSSFPYIPSPGLSTFPSPASSPDLSFLTSSKQNFFPSNPEQIFPFVPQQIAPIKPQEVAPFIYSNPQVFRIASEAFPTVVA